jgi:Fic family protein
VPPQRETKPEPLGHYEKRVWPGEHGAYGRGRNVRLGGAYRAFVPDPIGERRFALEGETGALLHEAGKALAQLNSDPPRVTRLNAVAQNLLRSESVASSRIEGVVISHKRLARVAYQKGGERFGDHRAAEVLGNVEAMKRAIELGSKATPFAVSDILDIHRTLLRHTGDREIAGVVRDKQNWIGGNDYNPVGAAYVPPPPERAPALLEDLCRFIDREDLSPIAQAAIAHAQFENIHPFADGNGRTGRALIYTTLRRRGEIQDYIPPISLVLAREAKRYIDGLGAYRQGRVSVWCGSFASAVARAAHAAEQLAEDIESRQGDWLGMLGQPRRDAAVRQLIGILPEQPVIDVPTARRLIGKSHVAVGSALKQLEEKGILTKLSERKWGRVWECGQILALVEGVEKHVFAP